MTLFLLVVAILAASGESRSESWSAFRGFVMLACLALAFVIAIVGIL